jgi:hypothetical protein
LSSYKAANVTRRPAPSYHAARPTFQIFRLPLEAANLLTNAAAVGPLRLGDRRGYARYRIAPVLDAERRVGVEVAPALRR